MGIRKGYDSIRGQYYISGFGFTWYFDTEVERDSCTMDAWEEHTKNLETWRLVADMLVSYR